MSTLSPLRARLASFANAYAVAVQQREAGGGRQLVIRTPDPIQPYRVVTGSVANEEHVLACVA